jgi:hypothetical protein
MPASRGQAESSNSQIPATATPTVNRKEITGIKRTKSGKSRRSDHVHDVAVVASSKSS